MAELTNLTPKQVQTWFLGTRKTKWFADELKKIEKSCVADGLLIEFYTPDGSNKKMKSYLKANGNINFIGQQSFSFCKIIRKFIFILY